MYLVQWKLANCPYQSKMAVAAGVGDDRSTDTEIVRHWNTLNAMNMRNIASDAALSDIIRNYFVQIS